MGKNAWTRGLRQRVTSLAGRPGWAKRARWIVPLAASVVSGIILACVFLPAGCSFHQQPPIASAGSPIIRVRVLQNLDSVYLTATAPPGYKTSSDPTLRTLNLPNKTPIAVTLAAGGTWKVGGTSLGTGTLTLIPNGEGTVSVANASPAPNANHANDGPYRGQYRLVPAVDRKAEAKADSRPATRPDLRPDLRPDARPDARGDARGDAMAGANPGLKFDVVNDLDLESYLAGVLTKELPRNWHEEAYKAQAIVARTYALYEKAQASRGREWDVNPDTRSQMYGGLAAETDKSRSAVAETSGIVVAYGPPGHERVFEAYFSSCCGGVTQSSVDAFGGAYQEPLSDQSNGNTCNASPAFNWGPVVVRKDELTRRMRLWGARTGRPEKSMAPLKSLSVQQTNPWGRPTRFLLEDSAGRRYSLNGEEMRWSVNCDADNDPARLATSAAATTLKSSFVKVITDSDTIRFVEGHGWGHGVGMCQWCAQRRAEDGMHADEIVLAAYPRARLAKAY